MAKEQQQNRQEKYNAYLKWTYENKTASLSETWPSPLDFCRANSNPKFHSHFLKNPENVVSGRIVSRRGHGNLVFMTINDGTDRLQVMCSRAEMGSLFDVLTFLDLGDWIRVQGQFTQSNSGEFSIRALKIWIDSKCLEVIPEEVVDPEVKQRQRYLDLLVNSESRKTFEERSSIMFMLRRMLNQMDFMEVETPSLQQAAGGATARPFLTHHNALGTDLQLRIAPELYLKQLVVAGFPKIFEMGKNFRNEGMSTRHNPEFTMLEVYAQNYNLGAMKNLCNSLIRNLARIHNPELEKKFRDPRVATITELVGIDVGRFLVMTAQEMAAHLKVEYKGEKTTREVVNNYFDERVAPTLIEPTYVCGFTMAESPLAKESQTLPGQAARFELYANGMEIANMYEEQNDPELQQKAFEAQGYENPEYIKALRHGLPSCGGLGIGMDRLVMLLTSKTNIRDVILFPTRKPEA